MIRRYSRRPVCNTLEIHDLLQSSVDSQTPASSPITSTDVADSISNGDSKNSEDTNPHLMLIDIWQPWSAVNSYTDTRLSTTCSSSFSGNGNEFESAASQQIQQMFLEIEELLFEEKKCSRVQRLEEESQEWRAHFPHFRILGTQIAAPCYEAYGWYPGPEEIKTPEPFSIPGSGNAMNEICLVGNSAPISQFHRGKGNRFMQKIAKVPQEEEEERKDDVIIAEGFVEEYLALHCKDLEDDCFETRLDLSIQYKNRNGLPSISPNSCRRNTIVTELFDEIWLEIVSCMEELIRKHWDRHVSGTEVFEPSEKHSSTIEM
ncbi:protein FAM149B1-like isoform X1 [Narcine bancroftii]|uniref:protein FAM149B1-like isoform X1 n=1 Tax=Narcine bancroftii TaxID=1343680 RepID=UPI003831A6DF